VKIRVKTLKSGIMKTNNSSKNSRTAMAFCTLLFTIICLASDNVFGNGTNLPDTISVKDVVIKENITISYTYRKIKININKAYNYNLEEQITTTGRLIKGIEEPAINIPVDLYIIPASQSNTLVFKSTKGIEVGIRIRF
jgi:hypothetical protein